jgi:hypothetical protein
MDKSEKRRYKEPVVFRNNIFGGLDAPPRIAQAPTTKRSNANVNKIAKKIEEIHRTSTRIRISSDTPIGVAAELLVVLSPRGSIISVPCAVIPDAHGRFKLFKLDYQGNPVPPITVDVNTVIAFLDGHHLTDPKSSSTASWGIMCVQPKSLAHMFGVFHLYSLPDDVDKRKESVYNKRDISYLGRYFSVPPFEVPGDSWYYAEMLRKLGSFMRIDAPLPTNSLRRYYQYKMLPLGTFHEMYSHVPDVHEKRPSLLDLILVNAPATNTTVINTLAEEVASMESVDMPPPLPPLIQNTEEKPIKKSFTLRGGSL